MGWEKQENKANAVLYAADSGIKSQRNWLEFPIFFFFFFGSDVVGQHAASLVPHPCAAAIRRRSMNHGQFIIRSRFSNNNNE